MAARKKPNAREQKILGSIGPVKGGLAKMLAEAGGDPDIIKAAEMVESMPGGMELLYTMAGEALVKKAGGSPKDAKKVRLYCYGGKVERAYAKGGHVLAAAAKTKNAGRGNDSMMLHMSPEEYEAIEAMWGPAEINPNTGIGEYGFLSKIWKKVKSAVKKIFKSKIFQVVAPIALSIFAPGLGTAIGGALTSSAVAAPIIGNALIQGGLSAAGGGDFMKGALSGAITGGLGKVAGAQVSKFAPGMSDATAAVVGSSLAGGGASALTGGDFTEGAIMGGLGQLMQPTVDSLVEGGQDMFNIEAGEGDIFASRIPEGELTEIDLSTLPTKRGVTPGYGDPGGPSGPPIPTPGYGEPGGPSGPPQLPGGAPAPAGGAATPAAAPTGMGNLMKYGLPLLTAAGALGGDYEDAEPISPYTGGNFAEDLPMLDPMNRQFQGIDPNAYYTYGQPGAQQSGQHLFLNPTPFSDSSAAGPTGGLGIAGGDQIAALIEQGAPVPFQLVRGGGRRLVNAGYTKDVNTGSWMPPPPELGQGLPGQAMGGYQESENRFVSGAGTGRSDDIPARLSDGEYVMDAETVALLGDGSGTAGAKRLDEMRQNLRKHKAKNLSKGGFSHKAKSPANYMSGGGMARLRTAAGRA